MNRGEIGAVEIPGAADFQDRQFTAKNKIAKRGVGQAGFRSCDLCRDQQRALGCVGLRLIRTRVSRAA